MKPILTISILILLFITGCSGYNIRIMGIDAKDFKGRDWKKVGVGICAEVISHEFHHWLFARLNGGGHFDWSDLAVQMDDYHNQSYGTQQNFHRSGAVGAGVVGAILTIIPSTRHSDFTLGYNLGGMIENGSYLFFNGRGDSVSDIEQLDHGKTEFSIYFGTSSVLTYINLNKDD